MEDINTKHTTFKRDKSLGVAIMCKNEEARIVTTLETVKNIANAIIIYDTGSTDVTFTVPAADLPRSIETLNQAREAIGFEQLIHDTRVAKISVVGVGMRSHPGVAQLMFQTLADKGINIQVISISEIKVSVLIAEEYTELALRALHSAYNLDAA